MMPRDELDLILVQTPIHPVEYCGNKCTETSVTSQLFPGDEETIFKLLTVVQILLA